MKKLTALLLALVMALSLTACSFVMLPEEQDPPADPKQEQQLFPVGDVFSVQVDLHSHSPPYSSSKVL